MLSASDLSYEDIPVALASFRSRLEILQEEKADLNLTLYCSQRLLFKQDNTITLGSTKLNLDYEHTQSNATTRLFMDKLEHLNNNICYVKSAIRALQEFQRHRLALDTVDDVFGRASPTDIQQTIDRCEVELRSIKKTSEKTVEKYLSSQRNPFTSNYAGKAMTEIAAQTEQKRTVVEKLKGLLGKSQAAFSGHEL